MLELRDHWVWDSWYVTHHGVHHAFFLRASRALQEPELRHERASIGHATSSDYSDWTLQPDALVPSDGPAWDDLATWTGSTVQGADGRWYLFYTGIGRSDRTRVQNIGLAVSDDLTSWRRYGDEPIIQPDPRWYETGVSEAWHERAWRDPWVFPDTEGGWHMMLTARAASGPGPDRGVVGHAWSPDLLHWEVRPPLSSPGGFGQLEVPQLVRAGGRSFVLFSCGRAELGNRQPIVGDGDIYIAEGEGPLGPFDVAGAVALPSGSLYAGRVVDDAPSGRALLAFDAGGGGFGGYVADPVPLDLTANGWRLGPPSATKAG